MKKNTLISLTVALFFCVCATTLYSQTTQEEYNYITKGYKLQIEGGLDMKKGYSLIDLGSWGLTHNPEHRECSFKGLVRQGQTKPCAIMMIYKRTDVANGAIWYICVPSIDAEDLWSQTLTFINTNCKENDKLENTLIWGLMHLASQQTTK